MPQRRIKRRRDAFESLANVTLAVKPRMLLEHYKQHIQQLQASVPVRDHRDREIMEEGVHGGCSGSIYNDSESVTDSVSISGREKRHTLKIFQSTLGWMKRKEKPPPASSNQIPPSAPESPRGAGKSGRTQFPASGGVGNSQPAADLSRPTTPGIPAHMANSALTSGSASPILTGRPPKPMSMMLRPDDDSVGADNLKAADETFLWQKRAINVHNIARVLSNMSKYNFPESIGFFLHCSLCILLMFSLRNV
jgi:hypothetical protein